MYVTVDFICIGWLELWATQRKRYIQNENSCPQRDFSPCWSTIRGFVKIISIHDEKLFSETAVGCTAESYFVIIILICSRRFWKPLASFEAMYCFICCRRRVAVARYRMICLLINSVCRPVYLFRKHLFLNKHRSRETFFHKKTSFSVTTVHRVLIVLRY